MSAPRRHSRPPRGFAGALLLALLATSLAGPAAASTPGAVTTDAVAADVVAEAWHRTALLEDAGTDVLCGVVLCPTVPFNPYPDDTLHVGVTAGQPDSVTVVALRALPGAIADGSLAGGTLTLPVAGPEAGTVAAEQARLVACVAAGPFDDTRGGDPEQAPRITCGWSSPVVSDPDDPLLLRVDLAPLVLGWTADSDQYGIALLADPEGDDATSWHLAFSARDRQADDAVPITALLEVTSAADEQTAPSTPAPPPAAPPASAPGPAVPVAPPMYAPPTSPEPVGPPEVAPEADADTAPQAVAAPVAGQVVTLPYPWPAVWLLPLALIVLVVGLGRAMGQEVTVRVAVSVPVRPGGER